MTAYIALLRAVNVGGTGKLPMADLKSMCEAVGFRAVRTYIASGNVVFKSERSETEVKAALEKRLLAYAGKPIRVVVRTAREMADALSRNPFPNAPGNRTVAIFLDAPPPANALDEISGCDGEQRRFGAPGDLCAVWRQHGAVEVENTGGQERDRPKHQHGCKARLHGRHELIQAVPLALVTRSGAPPSDRLSLREAPGCTRPGATRRAGRAAP